MKIKLTDTYSLCREKLRLSISEFINEEVNEKIFFDPDYSVFKNNIVFRCRIGLGGSQTFWTQFNGNSFTHINLKPYKNKHRHRFNREKDKDGNWTDIWTEPEYPENKIDYSAGFNTTHFGENEFGLLNMYNLYLWDDINKPPTHYKITNKFKTRKRTINDGSIRFNDFSIIKTGRSDIDDEIVVILGEGTQEQTLFSVLKIDRKTKTCF